MSDLALLAQFNTTIEQAIKARVAAEAAYGSYMGTATHVGDSRLREYASHIDQAETLLKLMEPGLRTTLASVLLAIKQGAKIR